jgi:FAD:protein FMN transferase
MNCFLKSFRQLLLITAAVLMAVQLWANNTKPAPAKTQTYSSQFENVLGTSFEMKLQTSSAKKAALAEKIALKEIERLSKILSAYDAESEFSQWMRTQNTPVKTAPELIEVLGLFDTWKNNTNGAINPAFETISQLWKNAATAQVTPSAAALQAAVTTANQQHWAIDYKNSTVTHLTNAPLVLNTFVKSYIINKATEKVMAATGIQYVVMNIGGDILVRGNSSETISITNPQANAINDAALDIIKVQNQFVATSGNYRRGYLINNQWYSHIINPATGMPATGVLSATVIASNATDAGALATAFNVLSVEACMQLASQFKDIAYLIITNSGAQIQSSNWVSAATPQLSVVVTATNSPNQWDPAFELTINLELAKFEGPYRRPFVAIWVEDKDKAPVRNLAVWFNKPRWLHDLRAWYRTNYAKFNMESGALSNISSATRSAGKYAIKWDGKDDKGEYVKNGTYTVHIEVAREHGTYQLISQEVKINNKTSKIELAPNAEVASASLEVKKK